MRVSIIIPVYEQWELCLLLIEKLHSLIDSSGDTELIVIDNGSSILPLISDIPNMSFLKCEQVGSYAARNSGLRVARGELIIFTDADCMPADDWIENIRIAYESSDKRSLLAGNVIVHSRSQKPMTAELYDIAIGLPQERYVSQNFAVTANLAIPKVIFEKVGLFDELRFSGGDAEFCQRAIKAGFKLKYLPDAVVYHPARKYWQDFVIKTQRVKGGQIRSGRVARRVKYFVITHIPPVWRMVRVLQCNELTVSQKVRVLWFQTRLWGVELLETWSLLAGKTPERR